MEEAYNLKSTSTLEQARLVVGASTHTLETGESSVRGQPGPHK